MAKSGSPTVRGAMMTCVCGGTRIDAPASFVYVPSRWLGNTSWCMVLEIAAQTTTDKSIFVLMQNQSLNVFYTDLIEIELVVRLLIMHFLTCEHAV